MVGKSAIPYAKAAIALNFTEGTVRVTVHRLRRRYRELLREEIGQTHDIAPSVACGEAQFREYSRIELRDFEIYEGSTLIFEYGSGEERFGPQIVGKYAVFVLIVA